MKQILLAIDGNDPSRPIFKYAADLCKHISARLCMLGIPLVVVDPAGTKKAH